MKYNLRFLPLICLLLAAAGLICSWAGWEAARNYWDAVDRFVFFTLNGSLENRHDWQLFWALGNSLGFDLLMGSVIAFLFYHYASQARGEKALERLCTFLITITVAVICKYITRFFPGSDRVSASAELRPAMRLSEYVPWFKPKDISYDSFPSDHGTLLFLSVVFLWFFAGWRYGAIMLAVAVCCCLPRLFSGAHWFSDMAVGSVSMTCIASAILLCTPLHNLLVRGYFTLLNRPIVWRLLQYCRIRN